MVAEPVPLEPPPAQECLPIDWPEEEFTSIEATLQAITIEMAEPLDRGAVVELRVRAAATFVGAGVDHRQKTTLKATDVEVVSVSVP